MHHTFPAERVTRRLRHGSSLPVVVDTAGGTFVAKLRGAGQGAAALVAEIIVAELAERLGLPVPERALIELSAEVETDDHNDELADLLRASIGLNLGFRFLEGAVDARPEDLERVDDEFAARVLWLDGLVMNPDRTHQNPNVMLWRRQPWLIDHGAALTFQHGWDHLTEDSPREPADYTHHIYAERAPLLARYDAGLARSIGRAELEAAVAKVPDAFMLAANPERSLRRSRATYTAFLWKRLRAPRPFVPFAPALVA